MLASDGLDGIQTAFGGKVGMSLVKVRLAAMMFLEYFIWGAWYVTVGTWLGRTRHFTGSEIALVGGTTAVAAIVSPFVVGWLADRFFATQHVIAVLHLAGAVLLWVAASQTTFGAIYWLILAYACLYMPTLALTNSLAFRQMKDRVGHRRLDRRRPHYQPSQLGDHCIPTEIGRRLLRGVRNLRAHAAAYAAA
jgi:MFS family permease